MNHMISWSSELPRRPGGTLGGLSGGVGHDQTVNEEFVLWEIIHFS